MTDNPNVARPLADTPETLFVSQLGHSGDGIAETATGRVFVPFALPGETVLADRAGERATVLDVLVASPTRVLPPCPHFGSCGGCSVQHLASPDYANWKRDAVVAALAQRGINVPVAPMIACPPRSRRRAVFTAERAGRVVTLGFNRMNSHEVVPVPECLVLVPAIVRQLGAVTEAIAPLIQPGKRVRVTIIAADNGLDLAVDDAGRLDRRLLDAVASKTKSDAIARLTVGGETIFQAREPEIAAGPFTLRPAAGGFIQAVAHAEEAMVTHIAEGIGNARMVADLFAGIGTFTLRLAQTARVSAFEYAADAIAGLDHAVRKSRGIKAVKAFRRDLIDNPLVASELKPFDAVVFDPPRTGAAAQCEQLALSTVARVVAVSCNPATFARDARILIDGGYRLRSVQPIDQFLWSPHVELVAAFER